MGQDFAALGPPLGGMPARPGGTFQWVQSRRGAARAGRVLSASPDKTLRLWDLASGECLRVLEGHSGSVYHVAALPDERALSASWDNTLRLWDLTRGECLAAFTGDDPMTCCAVAQTGGLAVVGDRRAGRAMMFEVKPTTS